MRCQAGNPPATGRPRRQKRPTIGARRWSASRAGARPSFPTRARSSARFSAPLPIRRRATSSSAPPEHCRPSVVCPPGPRPAELHKLGRTAAPGGYHMEYGYSCMGYEIAGGLGVKMARPDREVIVIVGDGSYLMLNSEIATSLLLDQKLVIVGLGHQGY